MSDTTTLALAACVVVVVILLLGCWDSKAAKPAKSAVPPARRQWREERETTSQVGTGVRNREFTNRYNDLTNLAGYDDYNAVTQYMAVEPEVYESHDRYSKDMGRSTSGASMLPVRDDRNDVVPRVGIRTVNYQSVSASPGARQEHSEIPDQMSKSSSYCIGW